MLYNSNPSVVEKLPLVSPFRGLITSFQKVYKSAYQLRFVVKLTLNSHLFQIGLLKERLANVLKEEAPQSTCKKTHLIAFLGATGTN